MSIKPARTSSSKLTRRAPFSPGNTASSMNASQHSLEDEFWYGLLEIAVYEKMTVPTLVKRIDHRRKTVNLLSAIRIFVFNYFMPTAERRKFNKRNLR
jgi:predicted DNA-binding ribbon-helix-helix protein